MISKYALAALSAFAALASTTILKPISDPVHLFPQLLKVRDTTDYEAFNPRGTHSFFWADESSPSSVFVANFTLIAPGENEDIIALKDIAQNLKKITCDDASNTITINLFSEDCFKVVENVWDWVNKNSDNTFILVTEAGQCDPDDVRDPYLVSGARFEENGWTVTFDAKRQIWSEVAHSFRLRTSRVTQDQPQEIEGPIKESETDGFYDAEINDLFAKAEALQADLTRTNRSGILNATQMTATRTAFSAAINATMSKGFLVLDKLAERYGNPVAEIVDSAKKEYQDLQAVINGKEIELARNCDSKNQTEWSLYEEVLDLEQSASEIIEHAFSSIYATLGQSPPQELTIRSVTLTKRLNFWENLWNGIKKAAETVINGVANLLGANKPLTIDLTSSWTPEVYSIGYQTEDFGVDLTIGGEVKTGGKMIAEFEVDVDFDAASKIQAHVNPEAVFGSVNLNLSASGYLTKPITWEPLHYDVPIPYAAFEIPNLVKVGPFVSLGLPLSVESLQGQAEFAIGAKATIPDSSIVLIDMLNSQNSVVSGWTPKFDMIGPDFSAEVSGRVNASLDLGLRLEATILGGTIGAKAALDAQVPRLDAHFDASTSGGALEHGVCNTTATNGIDFGVDVGVNINLNAGLVGGLNLGVRYDLLDLTWPLYETCLAF